MHVLLLRSPDPMKSQGAHDASVDVEDPSRSMARTALSINKQDACVKLPNTY